MAQEYTLAAYYFPNFHPDPRNSMVHGEDWTEWELVKAASPRFKDHRQPLTPLWGYEDETDPIVMDQKIKAAMENCIDTFIFDWYWYEDGPFLIDCLDKGFLHADNHTKMKFAIHWANHDWYDIHPAKLHEIKQHRSPLLYPGTLSMSAFEIMTRYVIQNYFQHPAYWKINGEPYFSIYDLPNLIKSFGSVKAAASALSFFRQETIKAGFPGLHLNQVLWNTAILPGDGQITSPGSLLEHLGYTSFTSYIWIHHINLDQFPTIDYLSAADSYFDYWQKIVQEINLPYFPNVTLGWDPSPRTVQTDAYLNAGYPFTPVLRNNTPQNLHEVLSRIKKRIESSTSPKILTVNAWNEWTEGSYLEPDNRHGYAYLQSFKNIFSQPE